MSAYTDKKAPVQFYFGNAAQDLTHLLPEDEFVQSEEPKQGLEQQMTQLEALVGEMEMAQSRVNFLLRDLKRIFG